MRSSKKKIRKDQYRLLWLYIFIDESKFCFKKVLVFNVIKINCYLKDWRLDFFSFFTSSRNLMKCQHRTFWMMLIQKFFLYLKLGLEWINNKTRWSNSFIQRTFSFFCLFHFTNLNLIYLIRALKHSMLKLLFPFFCWRPSIELKSFR